MARLNKQTALEHAERLGLDVEGLTWPELNSLVTKALKDEAEEDKEVPQPPKEEPKQEKVRRVRLADETLWMHPELAPTATQQYKYKEDLGYDIDLEEVSFEPGKFASNSMSGTYRIKGESTRKVEAVTGLPKENVGMIYNALRDPVPIVTWKGQQGYLYRHHRLPCVKRLLESTGYFEEYAHLFTAKHPENVWYAGGKVMACRIGLVKHIMREIQRKAAQDAQRYNF